MELNLQLFGGRGAGARNAAGGGPVTEEQEEQQMLSEFETLNRRIDEFLEGKEGRLEIEGVDGRIERYSLKDIKEYFLKEFNDGSWNYDDSIAVLYKDGKTVFSSELNENERFKLNNIEAVIVSADWGDGFYGTSSNIEIYNYKEAEYNDFKRKYKYGPRSLREVLDDDHELRIDFR